MGDARPQVIIYQAGLGTDSATLVRYEAMVRATSWDDAKNLLDHHLANQLPPRIAGRTVKGWGFHQNHCSPKSVLQWFMDLILGQQSERDFYFSVDVRMQRLDRTKA